jgi:hypothetical protein
MGEFIHNRRVSHFDVAASPHTRAIMFDTILFKDDTAQ